MPERSDFQAYDWSARRRQLLSALCGDEPLPAPNANDEACWRRMSDAYRAYSQERIGLIRSGEAGGYPAIDRVLLLKWDLRSSSVGITLDVAAYLPPEELEQLLPDVVFAFCAEPGYRNPRVFLEFFERLRRDWIVQRIEAVVGPVLEVGDWSEWMYILNLYQRLDPGLLERLARRAQTHLNPDIQECAEYFLEP